jgi:hypothetical protein
MVNPDLDYQAREDSYAALESDAITVTDEIRTHTLNARRAFDSDPVDLNTLSNELVELAILNQRLGDRVAEAGAVVRDTENYYKMVREDFKVALVEGKVKGKDKVAAGVADSMKMRLAEREFDLYNMAQKLYDQLVFLRRGTDKTIDALRSKLSYERADMQNA